MCCANRQLQYVSELGQQKFKSCSSSMATDVSWGSALSSSPGPRLMERQCLQVLAALWPRAGSGGSQQQLDALVGSGPQYCHWQLTGQNCLCGSTQPCTSPLPLHAVLPGACTLRGRGWKCLVDGSDVSHRHLQLPLPILILTVKYTRDETQTPPRERYDRGHVTSENAQANITSKCIVVRIAVPGT